ncbi:MAG TPA: hypothetical protein VMU95_07440 [Trebonia sp.]|nr:hypothetical protein [Trebonia sp.]
MNDLLEMTVVREEFATVHMDVPAETIMARGRAMRQVRRSRVAAGGLAVALGAGLGIPVLASGGGAHGASPGGAELAAWTVARQADGSVTVTIREMKDLPALNSRLAADGARVVFSRASTAVEVEPSAACLAGNQEASQSAAQAAMDFQGGQDLRVVLRPARIPAGDQIHAVVSWGSSVGLPGSADSPGLFAFMVHDTPACGV